LSRSGGQPSIPKEELYWRRIGNTVSAPVGVYSVGQRIPGSLAPLSQATLSMGATEKGKFYELHIDTDGIPDPRKAVETLIAGLRTQGVETVWASADAKSIRLQIAGSPMSWPVVLSLLPSILNILGIAVILISVYLIVSGIPGWIWGLLVVGFILYKILPRPRTRVR
ncbi:unnamed protein product, partial [marine sediment metagenome]